MSRERRTRAWASGSLTSRLFGPKLKAGPALHSAPQNQPPLLNSRESCWLMFREPGRLYPGPSGWEQLIPESLLLGLGADPLGHELDRRRPERGCTPDAILNLHPLQKFPKSASTSDFRIFLPFLAVSCPLLPPSPQRPPIRVSLPRRGSCGARVSPLHLPGGSVSASEQAAQTVRRQARDVTHS